MKDINVRTKEMLAIEKRNVDEEFVYRSGIKDLKTLATEWDQLQEQAKEIEDKLEEFENSRPRLVLFITIIGLYVDRNIQKNMQFLHLLSLKTYLQKSRF